MNDKTGLLQALGTHVCMTWLHAASSAETDRQDFAAPQQCELQKSGSSTMKLPQRSCGIAFHWLYFMPIQQPVQSRVFKHTFG